MNDIDKLLDSGVRGGNVMTIRSVLVSRKAEVVDVEERADGVIVIARTPRGRLESMGSTLFDALDRMATMVLRP